MDKYIIRQNKKGNEFYIFCLNSKANKYNINCVDLISGNYSSWGEASYEFYFELFPVKNKDIIDCIKRDFKRIYNEDIIVRHKLSSNDKLIIWGA
jgi:hypothetical protein